MATTHADKSGVPPDLAAALAAHAPAQAAFDRLGRSERYALILTQAKVRTRQGRDRVLIRMVARLGE